MGNRPKNAEHHHAACPFRQETAPTPHRGQSCAKAGIYTVSLYNMPVSVSTLDGILFNIRHWNRNGSNKPHSYEKRERLFDRSLKLKDLQDSFDFPAGEYGSWGEP